MKIITGFAASHLLRDYPGECSRLHGHNWRVEVEVEARALDRLGMAIDFKAVRHEARALAEGLDHRHLNEIAPFDTINPTSENLAAYFYRGLAERLNSDTVRIYAVALWETDNACVRYTEEGP